MDTFSKEKEIESIELHIDECKKFIERADALDRLRQNPDFKVVFEEGYFKDNAVRLVSLKAAPAMAEEAKQAAIVKSIDAIGELQQHLNSIMLLADKAEAAIADSREELQMLDSEDGEGEG